jgi:hypothetical protein
VRRYRVSLFAARGQLLGGIVSLPLVWFTSHSGRALVRHRLAQCEPAEHLAELDPPAGTITDTHRTSPRRTQNGILHRRLFGTHHFAIASSKSRQDGSSASGWPGCARSRCQSSAFFRAGREQEHDNETRAVYRIFQRTLPQRS